MLWLLRKWFKRVNSPRVHLERFVAAAAERLPEGGLVLDAGAGDCAYARHFPGGGYESADFCKAAKAYGEITHVCDLTAIPVPAERYDLVLCTQVLEHVPDPAAVLRELFRVLRPGGELRLTVPFQHAEHEAPYDFYRYTRYGCDHLLRSAGFVVEELDWLEGYFGALGYQLSAAAKDLPTAARAYGGGPRGLAWALAARVAGPLLYLLAVGFSRLDLRVRLTAVGQGLNYRAVARKPGGVSTA